ncbi:MAG: DUF599 domain-containing protein [Planctomycetes bacterium]|nr:DUF599 domain-containing protein [Planctomycetota bacterium]
MLAQTTLRSLLAAFERPVDGAALAVWVAVFPLYHVLYPRIARLLPGRTSAEQVDALRRSWISRVLAKGDVLEAAQLTRNLNMVNTFLASSALILLGFAANTVVARADQPGPDAARIVLILIVLALAFGYFVNALRHIGHFNLTIGADPALVEKQYGSAVDHFSGLLARASRRYTQGIRALYSVFPLFLWLFDSWLFLGVTVAWAAWFLAQDFPRSARPPEPPQ